MHLPIAVDEPSRSPSRYSGEGTKVPLSLWRDWRLEYNENHMAEPIFSLLSARGSVTGKWTR